MIKSLTAVSPWLGIAGGQPGSPYVVPNGMVIPTAGSLRYNGQDIEVFDGSTWQRIAAGHASITMTPAAVDVLEWAQKKMYEEANIKELAAKNVTVADALAQYELAAEKLKVVLTLTSETK